MDKKPIGVVTHYYDKIGVAIVKFKRNVEAGEEVRFLGANTDFTQTIKSIQFDHQEVKSAKKGQEVGIKVDEKVHEGNEVFEV